MILRAVERVDPRAVHGRSWNDLTYCEQIELLAFSDLRFREEAYTGGANDV